MSQRQKGEAFAALHARGQAFVIANAWDAGSSGLLTTLGFEAIATTSAGLAFSLARPDGEGAVSRAETLANARAIVEATHLPVSADLEGGFGDAPEACRDTILGAAQAGLVGGSIEDATGRSDAPIHPFGLAVERVRAAVEAARSLPHPFVLTARSENFLHGRPDLADTIRRLQAFQEAGADVLYAPGLPDIAAVRSVVASLDRPVNVLAGAAFTVAELEAAGVRRISLGGLLARVAYGAAIEAARTVRAEGSFAFARTTVPHGELQRYFAREG